MKHSTGRKKQNTFKRMNFGRHKIAEKQLLASLSLPVDPPVYVCTSARKKSLSTGQIFAKFYI